MSDGLDAIWDSFHQQRSPKLDHRFIGRYRAIVVETNDPLNIGRIRVRIPELHDEDLKPEDCPWAVSSFYMSSKRAGNWVSACIGDWVWIEFDKNHPYAPIWVGMSTPTRRKLYPLASVHGKTPRPVNEESKIQDQPDDFDDDYLPTDNRPMTNGWQDRYGHLDLFSGVGFYPDEHKAKAAPAEQDQLSKAAFERDELKPTVNNPDSKYMLRMSKYGNGLLLSDIGYEWKKEGSKGEFTGKVDDDDEFEINRWKYIQKLVHEGKASGRDQRKLLAWTRYGSYLEMRDVGWNMSRAGEYGDQTTLSVDTRDERWVKLKTHGGFLIQGCDIGSDAVEDEFVKRSLLDEFNSSTPIDSEDEFGGDMRMWRIVARTGRKFVIDDRGSDKKRAQAMDLKNSEIGRGFLVKGRASPGTINDYADASGDPRGYFWAIDERPGFNCYTVGTPIGRGFEMNDDFESMIMCSYIPGLSEPFKGLKDNEFLTKSLMSRSPHLSSHHMLIDHRREVMRFKSRAGRGSPPKQPLYEDYVSGLQQGLEIHDAPNSSAWVELIDSEGRGMWFSKEGLSIWRGKSEKKLYIWIDDKNDNIVVYNDGIGNIQLVANNGNVELIANRLKLEAKDELTLKSDKSVAIRVNSKVYDFTADGLDTNGNISANNITGKFPQIAKGWRDSAGGACSVSSLGAGISTGRGRSVQNINKFSIPSKIEPSDRL